MNRDHGLIGELYVSVGHGRARRKDMMIRARAIPNDSAANRTRRACYVKVARRNNAQIVRTLRELRGYFKGRDND